MATPSEHLDRPESISTLIYSDLVSWDVRLWSNVESRILGLDDEAYNLVAAAITVPIADDRFDEWLSGDK